MSYGGALGGGGGDRRVIVRRNDAHWEEAKVIVVKGSDSMKRFRQVCSKKLNLKAKVVYLQGGAVVEEVDELQNGDSLYISQGEPYFENQRDKKQETYYVSVLGTGAVGKSAITLRFVRDFFVKEWDPTIEDAYRKNIEVDKERCQLEILDTAGQEDFDSLRPQWITNKHGYIFVYSMDSEDSLQELRPFYKLHSQMNEGRMEQTPIVLVANKKDICDRDPGKRAVSAEQGRAIAKEWGAVYKETSALTGAGVDDVFETFIREVRRLRAPPEEATGAGFTSFWSFCSIL